MLHTVVMAGGSGTRFWPASRRSLPKQFLSLTGSETLIQQAVNRCLPVVPIQRTWVVTGTSHAAEVARQLPRVSSGHVLIEPCPRNTAPCIALAAARLLVEDPDAVMLVSSADHLISPDEAFVETVSHAVAIVQRYPDRLCLFGIPPTRPATGYGYIERGDELPPWSDAFEVARFREKPDVATAEEFLAAGHFLWNSGIFVWRAATILQSIEQHQPELWAAFSHIRQVVDHEEYTASIEQHFHRIPAISIDHAVLEASPNVCVLNAGFQWDDVGSWSALPRIHTQDENGNTVVGRHCGLDTRNCTIVSSGRHLIATIGIDDCVIVHTPTATLVGSFTDEAQLRQLLAQLESSGEHDVL